MPKGFIELQGSGGDSPLFVAVDQIARFGASSPRGSYVVCKTVEGGENDTLIVADTPQEISTLIEAAQQDAPRRSEFAESMGGSAVAAFGGARR